MKKSVPYKEYLFESLKDPKAAAHYLNAAMEESSEAFTLALKDVVKALGGGISPIAGRTGLNRESLYRMLSERGNPQLKSLNAVMDSLGLHLHVVAKKSYHIQDR